MRDGHQGALEGEAGVMTDTEGEGMSTNESITKELTAKQDEVYALQGEILRLKMNLADACAERNWLQVKQGASIPLPLDADGVVIRLGDIVKDGEDAIEVEELDLSARGWKVWLDDWGDPVYPSDLTHVIPTPKPETIEDVRRTVERGYTYRDQDVLCAIDHAYACGRRDGAGERA